MENKLNYQQAKRVRNAKFSDLFIDQMASSGIGGAIAKTVSLKTQAKIKGIKEKFDPLAIAKFMTFGSKLGPALLGKMTGRKQEDVDYFTGRLRHIRPGSKVEKLKNVSGGGETGMNEQLSKIYTFLKGSQENEFRLKNKFKSYEEEIAMEKQRRHEDLMLTLNKLMGSIQGGTPTLEKVGGTESLLDTVKRMIAGAFEGIKDLLALKEVLKSVPWGKLLGVMRWFAGPIGIALLGITSTVMFADWLKSWIGENVVNKNVISPEKAVELLKTPGAYREIEKYGGREALVEMAKTGYIQAKDILERGDIKEINKAGGVDFLEKVKARGAVDVSNIPAAPDLSQFAAVGPKRPEKGGLALPSQQKSWDEKWSEIYNPKTGKRLDLDVAPTISQQEMSNETTRMTKRSQSVTSTDVSPEPLQPTTVPAERATPVVPPSPISNLTNTNIDLNMQSVAGDNLEQLVNKTVTNVSQNQQRVGLRPSEISVRNDEETFMDLILKSTRVV